MYSSHEHTVNIMAYLVVDETVDNGDGETLERNEEWSRA